MTEMCEVFGRGILLIQIKKNNCLDAINSGWDDFLIIGLHCGQSAADAEWMGHASFVLCALWET